MTGAPPALFAWFKPRVRLLVEPLARQLAQAGLSPDAITLASVAGNAVAATLISQGFFLAGGVALLLANALDFLDGAVARAAGGGTIFGAFLDSVCDRYSELLLFLGLIWWYALQGEHVALATAFLAAGGSVMVSYTRARAEGLGLGGEVGLLQRPERLVLLGVGLITGQWLLFWALVVLAVLTNLTALQRIFYVKRQAEERDRTG